MREGELVRPGVAHLGLGIHRPHGGALLELEGRGSQGITGTDQVVQGLVGSLPGEE